MLLPGSQRHRCDAQVVTYTQILSREEELEREREREEREERERERETV